MAKKKDRRGRGFFPKSLLVSKAPPSLFPRCGECGLYKVCKSPKMPPSGDGKKRILVLAEAPGEEEDKRGVQLVGNSGRYLNEELRRLGVDMRRDCWLTNSLICRPPDNVIDDLQKIDHCRPNLTKTLNELKPEVIIPIGEVSIRSLLPLVFKDKDISGMSRWAGWKIPSQKLNAWICPTWHPAYLLRQKDREPVLELHFRRHLEQAIKCKGRPWDEVPTYKDQIRRLHDSHKAARAIRKIIKLGGLTSFDFETNMLKPEGKGSRILSCSICWRGKQTIAYPWHGEAIDATIEYLRSPLPKIGANNRFEHRWAVQKLKTRIRNWVWDCVVDAHLLDNRKGIISVKFQAFAQLGVEAYNDHIEQFLEAVGTMTPNRAVQEIDEDDLLLYNGLDSLVEYKIGCIQMRQMGYSPKEFV
jgi:uracil-DNA glycosylase family 4